MTKKTKKAAKKPRPKTVTIRRWHIIDSRNGDLSTSSFSSQIEASDFIRDWDKQFRAALVTITYEVRR